MQGLSVHSTRTGMKSTQKEKSVWRSPWLAAWLSISTRCFTLLSRLTLLICIRSRKHEGKGEERNCLYVLLSPFRRMFQFGSDWRTRRTDRRFFARNAAALTRTSATWRGICASSAVSGRDFSAGIARSDLSTVITCGTTRGFISMQIATNRVTETPTKIARASNHFTQFFLFIYLFFSIVRFELFLRR